MPCRSVRRATCSLQQPYRVTMTPIMLFGPSSVRLFDWSATPCCSRPTWPGYCTTMTPFICSTGVWIWQTYSYRPGFVKVRL
jgi:hypothetical protein